MLSKEIRRKLRLGNDDEDDDAVTPVQIMIDHERKTVTHYHHPKVALFVTDDGQWHSINLDQYRGGSVVQGEGFTATLIVRWVNGDVDTYEFRNIDTAHSVLRGLS